MSDRLYIFRRSGLGHTLNFVVVDSHGRDQAIDCTGCKVISQIRTTREPTDEDPVVSLSTDTPPTGHVSGMEWIDAAAGQLHIVIGKQESQDTDLFAKITSPPFEQEYYWDLVVLDSDGRAKLDPVILPVTFKELATQS